MIPMAYLLRLTARFIGTSTGVQHLATLSPGRRHYLDQVRFYSGHLPPSASEDISQ
jgi:hypothetical protein